MSSYIFLVAVLVVVAAFIGIAIFTKFTLNGEQYDRLKWVALHWDILVVFIALIVKLFNIPYGTETVGLVAGIGAALGGLLGVSNKNFYANELQDNFNMEIPEVMMEDGYGNTNNMSEEQ